MQPTPPQAIIWDMDGVLVYTNEHHFQAWSAAYQQYSHDGAPLSRQTFDSLFGIRNEETVRLMFGERRATPEFVHRVTETKETLFRARIRGEITLMPGVAEWLVAFQSQGLRQAVASSAPMDNIEVVMDEIAAGHYFEVIVSGDAVSGDATEELRSKPAPDIFLEAARRLDVPPAGCLVIEDSLAGVQAAVAAGMVCLAVASTHPAGKLRAANWITADFLQLQPQSLLDEWALHLGPGA